MFVGLISDAATAARIPNGLGLGLMVVPLASLLTGLAFLIASRRVAAALQNRAALNMGRGAAIVRVLAEN